VTIVDAEELGGAMTEKLADGRPLTARGWFDSEASRSTARQLYVGIERVNRLVRFDFAKGGIRRAARKCRCRPSIGKLPFNEGLEALVFVPKGAKLAGALIAISERGLDPPATSSAF
jgi:hypothetical protein